MEIGKYQYDPGRKSHIGKDVVIEANVTLGDCCYIGDRVRFVGGGKVVIKDYTTIHNDTLILTKPRSDNEPSVWIGYNCWVGCHSVLDGSGELEIRDGVRIGSYSQIWSHVAAGERLEGCSLYNFERTLIMNDCWLIGRVTVNPGVILPEKTTVLNESLITKASLKADLFWVNSRVKPITSDKFIDVYKKIPYTNNQKMKLMYKWASTFCLNRTKKDSIYTECGLNNNILTVFDFDKAGHVVSCLKIKPENRFNSSMTHLANIDPKSVYFNISTKQYTKKLLPLEIDWIKFLNDNKARFTPLQQEFVE